MKLETKIYDRHFRMIKEEDWVIDDLQSTIARIIYNEMWVRFELWHFVGCNEDGVPNFEHCVDFSDYIEFRGKLITANNLKIVNKEQIMFFQKEDKSWGWSERFIEKSIGV